MNKFFLILIISIIFISGCSTKQAGNNNMQSQLYVEAKGEIPQKQKASEDNAALSLKLYKLDKTLTQGEIITTLNEIAIYDDETEGTIIEFGLNINNTSQNDVYTSYDISPIVLNTGEQIDETYKCDIHRVFKAANKEGYVIYKAKTSKEEIKTIRWIVASPLYNGSEIIGRECDVLLELKENVNIDK
jgi:hypothetical protein